MFSFLRLRFFLRLLFPDKLDQVPDTGNILLDLAASPELPPEPPQFLVDGLDLAGHIFPCPFSMVQLFPLPSQGIDVRLERRAQHGELPVCVDAVGLQQLHLPLVAVEFRYIRPDGKGVVPVSSGTADTQEVQVGYIEGPETAQPLRPLFREAASRVHTALVTYAARDSDFDGHSIRAGEYLALLDGALLGSYTNLATLIKELSWAFEELSPEFITVYYGQNVAASDAEGVSATLTDCFPDAEVTLVNGGQPVYYYMISAE